MNRGTSTLEARLGLERRRQQQQYSTASNHMLSDVCTYRMHSFEGPFFPLYNYNMENDLLAKPNVPRTILLYVLTPC